MLTYTNVHTESDWTVKFSDACRKLGAEMFSCVGGRMQTPGWPDRYLQHWKFCGWLEVKRTGNVLSTAQKLIIERCNARLPATCFVIMLTETKPLYPVALYWPRPDGSWLQYDVQVVASADEFLDRLNVIQYAERKAVCDTV